MKRFILKAVVILLVLALAGGYAPGKLLAQASNFAFGRIVHVDPACGFVVINLGKEDGIVKGTYFDVYRLDDKVAEIKAIKLRRKFSACDIECTYENLTLQAGDRVRLSRRAALDAKRRESALKYEEIDNLLAQAQEYINNKEYELAEDAILQVFRLVPGHTQATKILNSIKRAILQDKLDDIFTQVQLYLKQMEYELAEEKVREALMLDPGNQKAQRLLAKIENFLRKVADMEPQIIVVDIDAPRNVIHSACLDIFRQYGCLITFSDPVEYDLHASKYIDLPYNRQFFGDGSPFTKNKIYYTVDIKQSPSSECQLLNRLTICLKGAYENEGRIGNYQTKENSPSYQEVEEMAYRIKNLSEEL